MDFTMEAWAGFLKNVGPTIPVRDYVPKGRWRMLRHDVDKKPENAMSMGQIEADAGKVATYYFRMSTFDPKIMKKLVKLGHEVGYHYETLNDTGGDVEQALKLFGKNLKKFRKVVDVQTVCMHGSPLGKWDNRKIFEDVGLDGFDLKVEPYLTIDYDKVFYITDTGRTWKETKASVRDFVDSSLKFDVGSTDELGGLLAGKKVKRAMIVAHPQRWATGQGEWVQELVMQNVKNVGKPLLRGVRSR